MDASYGLLYYLHIPANEDLAVSLLSPNSFPLIYHFLLYFLLFLSSVSLTYRVKSAHKIKLNDQQLLQWMVPILLVMLIYLGTWTISATPYAEVVSNYLFIFA